MRHTAALHYSWLERLHFRVFGHWPDRVVERRLLASDLDRQEAEREARMSGIALAFESKAPHTTPWLSIDHPVAERPDDLFAALARIGWLEDERYANAPPVEGVQEASVVPPRGSALFGGWTEAERKQRMPEVRAVLKQFGFKNVPWNRLTYAELA